MQIRVNVGTELLGMAELQTTREVYLLPGGMTGTDRLSYPLRHIGTAHVHGCLHLCAGLVTSMNSLRDCVIDEI